MNVNVTFGFVIRAHLLEL